MNPKCAICDSENTYLLYKNPRDYEYGIKHHFDLYKCKKCAIIFINPLPRTEEIFNMYPANYYTFTSDKPSAKITSILYSLYLKTEINNINKLCRGGGKVLDIGCGSGKYLLMLKRLNRSLELYGVDIKLSDGLKENKEIKFINADILGVDLPNNFFDVIVMSHLIEHVTNPAALVAKAYDLLKTGGVLIGETPNSASYSHKLWKSFWGPLHTPRHLIIFNKKNLTQLFNKIGFKEVEISSTLRPTGWAKSMKNVLIEKNIMKPVDHTTKAYPLFMLLNSPFIAAEYFLRNSSVIKFLARKK